MYHLPPQIILAYQATASVSSYANILHFTALGADVRLNPCCGELFRAERVKGPL